jgi:glycosyltransferase involved in cell wall biosynthesis
MSPAPTVFDNARHADASPALSVLIPFYRDDACELLILLGREAHALAGKTEIVVLDDGGGDETLNARVRAAVKASPLPARLITLAENEGRSKGRNRLAESALGGTFLFLDSDMRPDDDSFLQRWTNLAADNNPPLAFGGISLKQAPRDRRYAIHRRMAATGECVPCLERARQPEKYVYTSNLLVRRDAFANEAFDDQFSGWGWEDVEWAMRMSQRYPVMHVDNPATHMGLDTAEALAAKYEQSVPNFARVVARHFDVVSRYPSYRAARLLKKAPALAVWRPWLKSFALFNYAPSAARAFSLRLYRAALYAEAV